MKFFDRRTLLISFAVAVAGCGSSATPARPAPPPPPLSAAHAELATRLDAAVTAALGATQIAAASVTVVHQGETVLSRGYGLADVEAKLPAAADTIYRIGSITKSFTAVAILALAAQGKLALDEPVTTYRPGYDTHGKTITLRHLLTHTSGIKGYTELEEFEARSAQAFSRDEMVAMFSALPLLFDPGARWSYSNSGYYLLGLVIEQVTGKPYADAVRELAIAPAGLIDTAYCPPAQTVARHAHGYQVVDGALAPANPLDMAHPYAAGSLCSTAPDLARWLAALVGTVAVSPASWAQMITPAPLTDGSTFPYGLGLQVGALEGHARIGHGGGINGFVSQMDVYPDDELTVVVLTSTESKLAGELAEALARIALDAPEPEVLDLPLTAAAAARYQGRFDLPDIGVKLEFAYRDGALHTTNLDEAGQPTGWLPMKHQGDHVFVVPEVGARLTFAADGELAATVEIEQGGARFRGARMP